MATYWLVLELKETNSILAQGLNLGPQLYMLVLSGYYVGFFFSLFF